MTSVVSNIWSYRQGRIQDYSEGGAVDKGGAYKHSVIDWYCTSTMFGIPRKWAPHFQQRVPDQLQVARGATAPSCPLKFATGCRILLDAIKVENTSHAYYPIKDYIGKNLRRI